MSVVNLLNVRITQLAAKVAYSSFSLAVIWPSIVHDDQHKHDKHRFIAITVERTNVLQAAFPSFASTARG